MKITNCLFLLLALALCSLIGTTTANDRIAGGDRAVAGQFPYLVYMVYDNGNRSCGGFLVSMEWIVSSARCFYNLPTTFDITIYAGTLAPFNTSLETVPSAVQTRTSATITSNPNFDINTFNYNVAVLKLDTPFTYSDYVKPVLMANSSTFDSSQDGGAYNAYAAGYGKTLWDNDTQALARYVELPLVSFKKCSKQISGLTEGQQICAGGEEGKEPCKGDKGGPLIWTTNVDSFSSSSTKTYIIGIISYQLSCGTAYPGVYSDVVNMAKPWVDEQVGFDTGVSQAICGDGNVDSDEECDLGTKNAKHWKKNCCDQSTCTWYSTDAKCGKVKQSDRIGTCLTKNKTCTSAHKCVTNTKADGKSCPFNSTTTGTCSSGVCA